MLTAHARDRRPHLPDFDSYGVSLVDADRGHFDGPGSVDRLPTPRHAPVLNYEAGTCHSASAPTASHSSFALPPAGFLPARPRDIISGFPYWSYLYKHVVYGVLWPLLAQVCLLAALIRPQDLYRYADVEAILSFIFFLAHKMTVGAKRRYVPTPLFRCVSEVLHSVASRPMSLRRAHLFCVFRASPGAKYAGLSPRELKRLLYDLPIGQSMEHNMRLQVWLALSQPVQSTTHTSGLDPLPTDH